MGVNKVVAKFCAIPTQFRDHQFGVNQLTRGLSFLQSARRGRECDKPGLCKVGKYGNARDKKGTLRPKLDTKWSQK
jgi:hypothetical protein